MSVSAQLGRWVLALGLALGCLAANGQGNVNIGELSYLDKQYMDQQRALLADLVATNFGARFSGVKDHDLRLLQSLLDRGIVQPDQTRELQAMGITMGDLLAADLGMHWVVYEDRLGRSRALRYQQTSEYLFPVTMISRRQEADNDSPVIAIYQKAYDIIEPLRTPLPFQ